MPEDRPPKGGDNHNPGVRHARPAADADTGDTVCPNCGESQDLAKVKGCIKCLTCGFKFDCNGW